MLISEIKQRLKSGEPIDAIIEIKPYLSFVEKKILSENIINGSLDQDENGMFICDFFNRKLVSDIGFISNYTEIEINNEEFLQDYDFLNEQGIVDYVLNNMNKSDRYFIKDMVNKNIRQKIQTSNSIESIAQRGINDFKLIVEDGINKVVQKLPDDKQLKSLSKSLVKDLNKFDWNKVPMLKEMWLSANGKNKSGSGE
ncbi:MAG: hypothetical protein PHO58_05915 [Bacilli bacterium]|nr:hypothetical protein [Bacilli bacterium]